MLLLNYRTCEVFVLNTSEHLEPHINQYNHIGDFVFGFGDGINTSLGIVGGVGGANSSAEFRILAFLMRKFTGARAMVVQNYLAVKSQRETLESEIKREEFELEEYPEKEREEIEETYRAKEFEISLASSFMIGSKKAKLAKKIWVKGGIEMSVLGAGIPQLAYGIGADCIMQFC
jgi:vacuolar iron transporter family protein